MAGNDSITCADGVTGSKPEESGSAAVESAHAGQVDFKAQPRRLILSQFPPIRR
jgi:hypothetical protein